MLNLFEANGANQNDIDDITKKITDIGILPGLNTGISKPIAPRNKSNKQNKINKPWFDHECREKRRNYFRIKNRLRKSKSFQDIAALKNETKSYKKFINRKYHKFNKNLHKKLRELKSTNPREYRNLLNPKKDKWR